MKKKRVLLTAAVLALFLLLVAGVVSFIIIGNNLDRESRIFVDQAVPAIVSDWNIAELQVRASREFDQSVDYRQLEQFFEVLHELGDLEEYRGAVGESKITVSLYGVTVTAEYVAAVDFEAGSAEFELTLIKRDGQWQILGFRIRPEEPGERTDIV